MRERLALKKSSRPELALQDLTTAMTEPPHSRETGVTRELLIKVALSVAQGRSLQDACALQGMDLRGVTDLMPTHQPTRLLFAAAAAVAKEPDLALHKAAVEGAVKAARQSPKLAVDLIRIESQERVGMARAKSVIGRSGQQVSVNLITSMGGYAALLHEVERQPGLTQLSPAWTMSELNQHARNGTLTDAMNNARRRMVLDAEARGERWDEGQAPVLDVPEPEPAPAAEAPQVMPPPTIPPERLN